MTITIPGVEQGAMIAGKYRVERVLGAGGMGVVVAAYHVELEERVALKFLHPEMAAHGEAVTRFQREARAAVKIKSEHVAKVTDVGRLENGAPYMVMEFLEGSDLAGWLAQRGPLPVEQALEFVLQACEAVAEAHALGIVHRDLKPGNLFVTRRPDGALSVKVLDFGISKSLNVSTGGQSAMTQTSTSIGSPLYMSPEQMQSSRDVDARTDVWALGVILYELLTGSPPFVAETMPALVLRVVHGGPPAPLRGIRPDVPPALELAIQGCLERDRQKRLQSVAELAGALAPFAPKRARISVERISGVLGVSGFTGASTALPPSSGNEAQPAASGTAASWGKTQAPRRNGVWLFAAAALLVLVVGGLALRAGVDGSAADASVASAPNAPPAGAAPPVPESQLTPPPIVLPSPAPSPASPAALSAAAPAPAPNASTLAPGARRPSSKRSPTPTPSPTPARADTIARTAERAPAPPPPPPPPTPAKPNIFDDRK